MYISYSSPHRKATNTPEENHRRIILAVKTGFPIIAAQQSALNLLYSSLHLVIPLNRLLIRRRHSFLSALPSRTLLPLLLRRHGPITPLLLRPSHIPTLPLLPQPLAAGLVVHIVVRDAAALAPVAGGYGVVSVVVVVVVGFGVEGDDVPGVEEAGDVAEGAEEDVDEGVGGADAGFDPDGDGGEEDGEEAEEDVAAAHGFERVVGVYG